MEDLRDVSTGAASSPAVRRQHLAQLFDLHFDDLYRFCLARTGDRGAADDATSEAFTAAARHLAEDRPGTIDRPWLFVVARNRIVDRWRSHEREQRRFLRLTNEQRVDGTDLDPAETSATAERVLAAMASLPERQRAALTLRYLDEHSVAEVADRLDTTYEAAESLLARARRSFTTAWEHHRD